VKLQSNCHRGAVPGVVDQGGARSTRQLVRSEATKNERAVVRSRLG
jgi:hypothetical protein